MGGGGCTYSQEMERDEAGLPSHFSLLGTLPHGTVLPHSGRALPVQIFLEIPWKVHLEDVSL